MPKVKQSIDPLLVEIKGRKEAMHLTNKDIAKRMRVTERMVEYAFQKPLSKWDLGFLIKVCKALDMPVDTFRAKVSYETI